MLRTQTIRTTEPTSTELDVESSSPSPELTSQRPTKVKATKFKATKVKAKEINTEQRANKRSRPLKEKAKIPAPIKVKPAPDQKSAATHPSSPPAPGLSPKLKTHPPIVGSPATPQNQSTSSAHRNPSRDVSATRMTAPAPTSSATGPRTSTHGAATGSSERLAPLSAPSSGVVSTGAPSTAVNAAQAQPTAAQLSAHRAKLLKSDVFAAQMATAIKLDNTFNHATFREYIEQLFTEAGNPGDPVERMMLEQIALAHFRVGDLSIMASNAKGVEAVKILNSATARLVGEFRKMALALSSYRGKQEKHQTQRKRAKRPASDANSKNLRRPQ